MAKDSITHSISHQLNLGLSQQILWYAVTDKSHQILASGNLYVPGRKELIDLIESDAILSEIYTAQKLVVMNPKFIVAPQDIGSQDSDYELFKLSNKANAEERLFRDHNIEQKEIQYAGNREFIRILASRYPNLQKHHIAGLFINMSHRLKSTTPNLIQLAIVEDSMFLTISSKDDLILANSYPIANTEDVFYFTMLAVEQLKLDPQLCNLSLYQELYKEHSLINLFQNYLQKISLIEEAKDRNLVETWITCA